MNSGSASLGWCQCAMAGTKAPDCCSGGLCTSLCNLSVGTAIFYHGLESNVPIDTWFFSQFRAQFIYFWSVGFDQLSPVYYSVGLYFAVLSASYFY